MRVIYPADNSETLPSGSIATIGVFDGVHAGHRRLLYEIVTEAEQRDVQSLVITFERSPREVLDGGEHCLITSIEHRLRLFAKLGVDVTVVLRFTPELAALSAKEFALRIFKETLSVGKLVLGFNGRFGRGGQGGIELCRELNIPARRVPAVKIEGEVVSSTAIREAILAGDLMRAARFLGRPYSIIGRVIHGDSMGTDIGYPTANLDTDNELLPAEGVYAGRALLREKLFDAAISIGKRTTVHGEDAGRVAVEVYLIDENMDLYGEDMEVQFLCYIRKQKHFPGVEALKLKIREDVEKSRNILKTGLRRN